MSMPSDMSANGRDKLSTTDYLRRWFNRFIFHTARTDQGVRNAIIPRPGNDYQPHALRPRAIGIYAAVIIVVKIVSVGFVTFYADQARQSDVTADTIVRLTNQARQQYKVGTLRTNSLLTKAAQAKAADMVRAHYFAHISPTKVTPWYWFKQAGYSYSYAGENLAIDYVQSEDVIQAWLNSPSHRANLLGAKYKDIGVAITTGKIEGVDSLLVVQMFGAPVPKPTVKPATKPAQTPAPTATQVKLATITPKPIVLGESSLLPPAIPTIATPDPNSVLRTNIPSVVGLAEPGSVVTLSANGHPNGIATAGPDSVYTVIPSTALPDGPTDLSVVATARGLSSAASAPISVTVDTLPPSVDTNATYALSSVLEPGGYDIWTTASADATTVTAMVGAQTVPLIVQSDRTYFGHVATDRKNSSNAISVAVTDPAGNRTEALVVNPDLWSTGVVAPSSGVGARALQAVFFSRRFLMVFIVLMLVLATINVFSQIEHQHHPTILASVLVIYLAGALLFV